MNRIIFFICLFFRIFNFVLWSYTDDELRYIITKIRQEEELSREQKQIVDEVWEKFTKAQALSIFEDNLVFHYMNSVNERQLLLKHPQFKEWAVYRRLSVNGLSLAAQHFVKDGFIHEFLPMKEGEEIPYHIWFPPAPTLVVYESGQAPYRRLSGYYLDKADTQTLVLNTYDNYSPIFSPDGEYLLYLSDRDRLSPADKRVSVYARGEQGHSSKELRLTDLLYIEPNTVTKRDAFVFTDSDHFAIFVDGKKTEFSLSKLLAESARLAEEISGKLKSVAVVAGEDQLKLSRRILSEKEINGGRVVIYEKDGNEIGLELAHLYSGKRQLPLMSAKDYSGLQGPLWLEGPGELLFVRSSDGRYEIWSINLRSGREVLVSRKYENCFGMVFSETGDLLAYILERAGIFFVFVLTWPELKPVADYVADRPEWVSGEPLLHFSGKDLLYRGREGVFLDFNGIKTSADEVKITEQSEMSGLPVFSAPYQILPQIKSPPDDRTEEVVGSGIWSADDLSTELRKLDIYIKAARNIKELDEVRMRFNTLHEQVRLHQESPNGIANKANPALIQRWIRDLNRQKTAINTAEIILQNE